MAKMMIMQGLPASGKSTRAQELMKTENAVRINKDLLRTMLHFDKFSGPNEDKTRRAARVLATLFLEDTNVIIDDTNLNPRTRQGWVDLAREVGARVKYERMNTSVEECIKRDAAREKPVGEHVIIQMALQYQDYLKGESVVICDLDGTICDTEHRLHFLQGEKKDWKGFFGALDQDPIREDIAVEVTRYKQDGCKIILVSGRPDNYRAQTEWWLDQHRFPYDALLMRDARDNRADTEVKADIYEKYLKNLKIENVFDDRPSVIRMWREKGLEVTDVGKGIEF